MLSGCLDLARKEKLFDDILPAHETCLELARVETTTAKALFVVERDATQPSLAERYWGQKINEAAYKTLRQEITQWPLQSIIIEYTLNNQSFRIERNQQAECALFVFVKGNKLYLHWDPVTFYPLLNKNDLIDLQGSLAMLELVERYRSKTPFKNVFHLPERSIAMLTNGDFKITAPPHIAPPQAAELQKGADPIATLHALIKKNIGRRALEPHHTCAILSSGLDTTVVAHFLKEYMNDEPLMSFGYQGLDKNRDGIFSMRMETVRKLTLHDFYPDVEENMDHAYDLARGKWWPEQTQTTFAEQLLIKLITSLEKNIAFTGIGGDELGMLKPNEYKNYPKPPPSALDQFSQNHSLISTRFKKDIPSPGSLSWPNGYAAYSVFDMANSSSYLYLREGIWKAHPLAGAEIQTFAQFLPSDWRYKRRISREALTRLGYSAFFTAQIPKEDFSFTMENLMLRVDWQKWFGSQARLFDLGLIEQKILLEAIEQFKQTRNPFIGIKIMAALHFEASLQSL